MYASNADVCHDKEIVDLSPQLRAVESAQLLLKLTSARA